MGQLPDPSTLARILCAAADAGDMARIETVLHARANVHAEYVDTRFAGIAKQQGRTPLHCAAAAGHKAAAKLLLRAGAGPKDKVGYQLAKELCGNDPSMG